MPCVPGNDFRELHVFPRGGRRNGVTHHPDQKSDDPKTQAQTKGSGQRAIENGDATGSATQKNGFGQGPVERNFKAREMGVGHVDQTSDECAAAKRKESEEEGGGGKGDGETEDDLDQAPEPA